MVGLLNVVALSYLEIEVTATSLITHTKASALGVRDELFFFALFIKL